MSRDRPTPVYTAICLLGTRSRRLIVTAIRLLGTYWDMFADNSDRNSPVYTARTDGGGPLAVAVRGTALDKTMLYPSCKRTKLKTAVWTVATPIEAHPLCHHPLCQVIRNQVIPSKQSTCLYKAWYATCFDVLLVSSWRLLICYDWFVHLNKPIMSKTCTNQS